MIDLKSLSASLKGTQLYDFLEEVKATVSDVRQPIVYTKPEIEIEVRKAVCDVIDGIIIQRLKTAENIEKAEDNWQ